MKWFNSKKYRKLIKNGWTERKRAIVSDPYHDYKRKSRDWRNDSTRTKERKKKKEWKEKNALMMLVILSSSGRSAGLPVGRPFFFSFFCGTKCIKYAGHFGCRTRIMHNTLNDDGKKKRSRATTRTRRRRRKQVTSTRVMRIDYKSFLLLLLLLFLNASWRQPIQRGRWKKGWLTCLLLLLASSGASKRENRLRWLRHNVKEGEGEEEAIWIAHSRRTKWCWIWRRADGRTAKGPVKTDRPKDHWKKEPLE